MSKLPIEIPNIPSSILIISVMSTGQNFLDCYLGCCTCLNVLRESNWNFGDVCIFAHLESVLEL